MGRGSRLWGHDEMRADRYMVDTHLDAPKTRAAIAHMVAAVKPAAPPREARRDSFPKFVRVSENLQRMSTHTRWEHEQLHCTHE